MSVVVGLDIGTTKVACFIGVKNDFGKVEIISKGEHASLGVDRGIVSNINQTVESINKAVQQAREGTDMPLNISTVYVGIAGQHIKSLQHRGMLIRTEVDDEVSQEDVDKLIEDMYRLAMVPGEEIIHVLPQEYIVDDMRGVIDPIGSPGIRLEANFHIITGRVQDGKNINRCIELAGLTTAEMILEPLASAEAVLSLEEKEGGVALVDIGGGTTDIAIFQEGVIRHTAVIPLAGNIITEDIKNGCSILKSHAEKLKVQFGSALSREALDNEVVCIPSFKGRDPKEISVKNLARIIQARVEEILESVYFEIKKSGYEKKLHAGIVLTGGGAQLSHITQLCEFITGLDTRVGYPTDHVASVNSIENITNPIYSTGIGLVLLGFKDIESKGRPMEEKIVEPIVEEVKEEVQEESVEIINKEREAKIKGHSKGILKGKYFTRIREEFIRLFDEDEMN